MAPYRPGEGKVFGGAEVGSADTWGLGTGAGSDTTTLDIHLGLCSAIELRNMSPDTVFMDWTLECEELRRRLLSCPVASAALKELLGKYLYPYKAALESSENRLLIFRHGMEDPVAVVFVGKAPRALNLRKASLHRKGEVGSQTYRLHPQALNVRNARFYLLRACDEPELSETLPFDGVFSLGQPGALASFLQVLISDLCFDHASELMLSEEALEGEAIGIGVTGSVAMRKAKPGSDLDLFVVVEKRQEADSVEWYWRLKKVLAPIERDITVFVYPLEVLEEIPGWYALRMASGGRLIYDREGVVGSLFRRIREAARRAGLEEVEFEGDRIWRRVKPLRPGESIEVRLT